MVEKCEVGGSHRRECVRSRWGRKGWEDEGGFGIHKGGGPRGPRGPDVLPVRGASVRSPSAADTGWGPIDFQPYQSGPPRGYN